MTDYWWQREPGEPREEKIPGIAVDPSGFSRAVKDDLESQGYMGYALGKPTSLGDALWFQLCILDPQNEIPKNFLVYVEEEIAITHHDEPKLISTSEFKYSYERRPDNYQFTIANRNISKIFPEKQLAGTFDRKGNFKTMQLIDAQ